MKGLIIHCLIVCFLCTTSSCGVYSFSGASVPKEVKTISIEYIQNKAPNAWSTIDNIFNQELRNKMVRDGGLKVIDGAGDYQIKGYISDYRITAQAPTTGSFSTRYRLDITVQLEFKDIVTNEKVQWNQPFTNFEVYENDITGKEDQFIKSISVNIANSIFNKMFSTW
jgi:hypothetical protein